MMKQSFSKAALLAGAIITATASVSSATTYNIGDVTNGFSSNYGLKSSDPTQNIDYFNFTIDAAAGRYVSGFELTVISDEGTNLFPVLALADSTGTIIAQTPNTNGGNANDGVPITLSLFGVPALADGSYTAAVGAWISNFVNPITDSTSTASFNKGSETNYSFEISVSTIPLPAGLPLLAAGLGVLGFVGRRRKAKQA